VLDLVDAHPAGMTPDEVARELGVTPRRILQLENRALLKARVAAQLVDHLEALRPELPAGCVLETAFPASLDSSAVRIIVTVNVPSMVPVGATGLAPGGRRG
jgi:hypothetical protein